MQKVIAGRSARECSCRNAHQADAASTGRIEESCRFNVGIVIEHSFYTELEPVTAFEHCLSVDKRDWTDGVAAKNDLLVFKRRDTLDSVFLSAGRERCFHSRARVDVILNAEARRERVRATGADEARVVESHHDHDAVANDPLINGA